MVKNYILIAIRNLVKRRVHALINILGLAVGLTAVILISLFISSELSYDKFHQYSDTIYRISWMSGSPQTRTPHPLAQAIARDFEEVEAAVSLSPLWGPGLTKRTFALKNPEQAEWYEEKEILGVDSTFFDVFSFEVTKGNKTEVLKNVGGILISEGMANKYFGAEEPIGKYLAIDNENQLMMVEGVFKDVPNNSHMHFDFLISYVTLKTLESEESEYYEWSDFGHFNYVRLNENTNPKILESKMMEWAAGYLDWDQQTLDRLSTGNIHFGLQPLTSIHLKSQLRWELEPNGNINYIYIMTAAAIFILIIACFNFMNLSTAKSMERASEVGIRKSLGAQRKQIIWQFLGESILLTSIAVIIAGFLVEVTLPYFNNLIKQELVLLIFDPVVFVSLFASAILLGLLSGLYPAIYLSALKPILVLKGKFFKSKDGQLARKILVTLQFAISMFLIAGSITIINQINYMQGKNLGFDKSELIVIPMNSREIKDRFEVVQTQLLNVEGIKNVSAASNIPGKQFNQNPMFTKDNPEQIVNVSQSFVDYELLETLGIKLIEGRNFSKSRPSDATNSFILNESAVLALGFENAVGEVVILDDDSDIIEGEVIGVIEDFNYNSLHQAVRPLAIQLIPAYNYMLIKLDTDDFAATIVMVESVITSIDNKVVFEFDFMDDSLNLQYANENRMASVFGGFAILAIIIACLGLGGLASINFSFRKKEIGIKKIMGASTKILIYNLLKENTIIVLISIVLSMPFYWVIISNWLQNFNYRITINPAIFLGSGIGLLLMSWITLGYLTFKTVRANPINALKEE